MTELFKIKRQKLKMLTFVVAFALLTETALGFFFTGTDYRCHSFGGECKTKYETCCPGGWTYNRTCEEPNWCCIKPTACETNKGTCVDPYEEYCPGSYDDSLDCGGPFNYRQCCVKDSPCEVDYTGKCIPPGAVCKGVVIPDGGDKLCGTNDTFQCCVHSPSERSQCVVGKQKPFCDFLGETEMTLSDQPNDGTSAKANLEDQCSKGNAKTDVNQCGGGNVCLRPSIVNYLSCMGNACPKAEVISVASNTQNVGENRPFCKGKAVGLRIDMSIQPATCDISNIENFCFELKGTGSVTQESATVYLLHCIFN